MADDPPAATSESDTSNGDIFPPHYVWNGHGLGFILNSVPYGCSMDQQRPVAKLKKGVPLPVLELDQTDVGALGEAKLYGRVEFPAPGWVDITTCQCERRDDGAVGTPASHKDGDASSDPTKELPGTSSAPCEISRGAGSEYLETA